MLLLNILPAWLIQLANVAEDAGHASGHAESGPPELPNLVSLIWGHASTPGHWMNVIFAMAMAALLSMVAVRVARHRAMIPGRFQNVVEMIVEALDDFFHSVLGKDARRYTPFLGTLFIYIFAMNLFGLIPGMMSPTGGAYAINTTAALAICVFCYVQYTGIRRLGFGAYVHHFLGEPRDVVGWVLAPINLVIHVFGELAKPTSLALRLFGNITGEDVLIAVFVGLGISALSFIHSPVGLPLQIPFIFLAILTSLIQALVFTLLSTIYFLMMLPHHEEEHAH